MSRSKRVSAQPPPRHSQSPPSLAPRAIEAETVSVPGVKADYEAFLSAAHGVDPAKVQTFRGDASLAYHNVSAGLDAVLSQKGSTAANKVEVDWAALEELPRIALGLVFAVEQVDGRTGANVALQKQLARGRVLRDIGLGSADVLAKSGDIPAKDVKALRLGSGPLNLARALVKVSEFYTKHRGAAKGKTPFTEALVKETAELGRDLLKQVKPKGTLPAKDKALAEAQRDRDQFAALLVERHETLERVGGWFWGRNLGDHVPALQSRVRSKPRAKKKPETTHTGTPTGPNTGNG